MSFHRGLPRHHAGRLRRTMKRVSPAMLPALQRAQGHLNPTSQLAFVDDVFFVFCVCHFERKKYTISWRGVFRSPTSGLSSVLPSWQPSTNRAKRSRPVLSASRPCFGSTPSSGTRLYRLAMCSPQGASEPSTKSDPRRGRDSSAETSAPQIPAGVGCSGQ